MPRLTASFWVHAYLRRLSLANVPAFVVQKGDETAGAVLVKANPLDGSATLFYRISDLDSNRRWAVLKTGPQADIDETIARQCRTDPDIWVIEVEDRAGRTLLDEDGLFS